ncbi:hypothetical protein LCGC14_0879020 [marine sediment metagenome]|uniref:Uncharacterized protein n=1 Tax=marine sediment metagenome TaxID=412755 RepID=A0A0F9P7C9_9ZZZZ
MAEKANLIKWEVEFIPDEDDLYYRMHEQYFKEDLELIPASGFRPKGNSLSTDWNKYSTPKESRLRTKKPEENRIVQMNTRDVRDQSLRVQHNPSVKYNNRAHTEIFGLVGIPKSELNEVRMKLSSISIWVDD